MSNRSSSLLLRLVTAGFTAVHAVILAIFSQPDAEVRLAETAVFYACAMIFGFFAHDTLKLFFRHAGAFPFP
ncbi:MAG: hypothetical protein DMG22_02015 [Acidobacteria bacterium]|nr:MAG: hypothetical protein DMG22_02015 [Acidobacteriota bacterium]